MFGYVRPLTGELKVAEYERYRGVYCGVCRAMGKVTGQLSRLTLSYDMVLLACVRMILTGIQPEFCPMRCAAHPMNRRAVLCGNDALQYTAAVSGMLTAAKNRDDRADERGMNRIIPTLLSPASESFSRRGSKYLPDNAGETMKTLLSELTALERENCDSADRAASVFGELLGYAFSAGLEEEARDTAYRMGYSTGRFVYLCDAAEDLPEDAAKGRYNPLLTGWGDLALQDGMISPIAAQSVKTAANIDLEPLGEAAEELDGKHPLTPIVKNIVYLGLPAAMERVCSGKAVNSKKYNPMKQGLETDT
ncbi:MAG: hypothetical protein IJF78_09725 [Clostridia bacterium]|nr:hypothetical protein [Clostridia bacterium]